MSIENSGPQSAYPGPENEPTTGADHGAALGQTSSEPKQGNGERPADWNPPPGNPGSDQDSQVERENGTARTDADDELGFDPDSPDVSDPQVDPLHPARTSNDPISRESVPGEESNDKITE